MFDDYLKEECTICGMLMDDGVPCPCTEFEPDEPTTEAGMDDLYEDYPGQYLDGAELLRLVGGR